MINHNPDLSPRSNDEKSGGQKCSRHDASEAIQASMEWLHKAKRTADESLRRAQDAPEPHTSDNLIFVALWEAHLRDREALFVALRGLDASRKAIGQFDGTG